MILLLATLASDPGLAGDPDEDRAHERDRMEAERGRMDAERDRIEAHRAEMEADPVTRRLKAEEEALTAQMRVLMIDYEQADGKLEKQRIRGDIEDLAGATFDHRTKIHAHRVAKVEERLELAKTELEEREANRDMLIEEWLTDHLED